ncbi:MAG TPA: hypothetical protein VFC00_22820 [Micromonosporaceae bacterium]|nr:hypothetical protein [Micromonosporaceae bacterium]
MPTVHSTAHLPSAARGPWRAPGAPHATTIAVVDLLPGSHAYADTFRDAPPILVIDTGPTEIHLCLPGERITLDDLRIVDVLIEALAAFRTAANTCLD